VKETRLSGGAGAVKQAAWIGCRKRGRVIELWSIKKTDPKDQPYEFHLGHRRPICDVSFV